MTHALRAAAAAITHFASLTGAALSQDTITVTHAQGETEVPVSPDTVVSFDLAALDTLDALGVEADGVPEATYPDYLSDYADAEKVGSLFEPDFEAVNAMQPDLIVVAGRSAAQLEALSEIAPTIDLSNDWQNFVPAIKQNTGILGRIFDRQDAADELIAGVDDAIAKVGPKAEAAGAALIVMTSGGKITAYGPGSRFGWIHGTLGVVPAIEDVEAATHGEAVSFEFLLETNPDWLYVIDRDAGVTGENTAKATLDNELVARTTAWSEDQVVYIHPVRAYVVNGGIQALADQIEQIGTALEG